ncbi:RsbRD N-terminal domain-containing protein [Streptomyces antarcticus]|uniref:RsbRD N-terminal domain-containing protein n=1 Tax=Streptomyces antarcticus TaxID=2996458 RepID=UPI0022AE5834|nr:MULTISPECIES: RsbRD N-terminal domain-containing protein [unclassified Streptomyces]
MKEVVVSHADLNRAVTALSLRRARTGATPTATSLAVLALKEALLEAECFISGIRPTIAQTIAHLGIDLSGILTEATLADALSEAVRITAVDGPDPRTRVSR